MQQVTVFISYSHRDKAYLDELEKHLANLQRSGTISVWYDWKVEAGGEFEKEIQRELEAAHMIILLVSSDFMTSDWCNREMGRAIERHNAGEARVIPIKVREVDWDGSPLAKLKALPEDGKPVATWENRDEAFTQISRAIRSTAESMIRRVEEPKERNESIGSLVTTETVTRGIEIRFDGDLGSLDNHVRRNILDGIGKLIDAGQPIRIRRISEGSVKIELELTPDEAERLYWAVKSGAVVIEGLKATDARFTDGERENNTDGNVRVTEGVEELITNIVGAADKGDRLADTTLTTKSEFTHLEFLSEGGQSTVFRAHDELHQRTVAIKFIRPEFADRVQNRELFLREVEITARLEHPGIAPVYGMGHSADGRPFCVMRFIDGEPMDAAIRRLHGNGSETFKSVLRDLLNRFVAVCKTIAYAHNRGVIHGDIKPGNVVLQRHGETLVMDWGLATPFFDHGHFEEIALDREEVRMRRGSSSTAPNSETIGGVGTLAYMSPEVITCSRDRINSATDIYSLGVTLYKLLTGQRPFEGKDSGVLREQICRGAIVRPRQLQHGIASALEAICLKAMARNPMERYDTAMALAEDVERYLADEPVLAYPESLWERAARWVRRHRIVIPLVLMFVLSQVVVTAFVLSRP